LDGICSRRNEAHQKTGSASATLFVLTTLLAFFDTISGKILKIQGMELTISTAFAAPLGVIVSGSFLACVIAMTNQMVLDRYIDRIGSYMGLWSFRIFLADRTIENLWLEPLVPKYFGLRSKIGHKTAFGVYGFLAALLGFIFFAYPTAVCLINAFNIFSQNPVALTSTIMAGMSCFICFMGWVIVFAYMVRYKFDPAELDEVNGQPTEALKAKLSEMQSKNVASKPSDKSAGQAIV
jgi:hypothetical protein